MSFEHDYNKMRPYKDDEVPEALSRVMNDDTFKPIISYLYEGHDVKDILRTFEEIRSVAEFQSIFSHHAVNEIVRKTSDGLTFSGLDDLDASKAYLFIANHRDIVLDSAIMQALLLANNHRTSQITFGSNLMTNKFIVDIGKLNKMFTFYRGGSRIQMYRNALLHSEYIQHVITKENESVWIAQRDGRTKDGDDKTQISLIKMLTMGKEDPFEALRELNIVPVTISYEYEPCDIQKIQEQCISKEQTYKKKKNEDLNSVLSGITGKKGRIHLAFGEVLNSVIDKCAYKKVNLTGLAEKVVANIDRQMYENYALYPVHYIAFDLLENKNTYLSKEYNEQDVRQFIDYMESRIQLVKGNKSIQRKMFFSLYAMPLINKLNHTSNE